MRRQRVCGLTVAVASVLSGGAAFAQLPGDLDGNGEVSLSDWGAFVGCVTGAEAPSLDPLCVAAMFDDDDDVDLRDFAGFQVRFGFGVGPPQIDRFSPAPGTWVVDDIGLTEVTVGFSEPVTVPTNAVDVWLVGGGTVTGFATSYDPDTFVLTVLFASALRDDQVTVVVDYTIEDVAGNPLDGEILDPKNAALPSGNGINGGQGVFRIRVLQGDANRDGTVDDSDLALINASLGLCDGDPDFNGNADLNADGCVDAIDANIVTAAFGNRLPATDGTPPAAVTISAIGAGDTIQIDFSESMYPNRFKEGTCYLVDENGTVLVPLFVGLSTLADSADYFFVPAIDNCQLYTINISNALTDSSGELLSATGAQPCP